MTLAPGQSLSHYEILGDLGVGAMGEVYRALDTRLDREVAVKVLPEHFAEDEERLRRFEREAKSLASLNHPNVAQIHGVDQVGDTCFLVLELVPGETVEDRLARGRLSVDEAIDICRQIAEGLEAAHAAGVIHRDLKPANVRITPDGKVKVLDFGLAKPAREGKPGSTHDSVLTTEAGRLLGTPTYMAPEQARGRSIDRRVDVWAFGCVLYECLCGVRAFEGETPSDVLASVLHEEPDWSRLPTDTPPHVRALLARCLEKDARLRQRDLGDAWLELAGAHVPAAAPVASARRRGALAGVALALAAGTWLGFALHAWLRAAPPPVERPRVTHGELPMTHGLDWNASEYFDTFAVSPDGDEVVYQGQADRDGEGSVDVLVRWRRSEPGTTVLWQAPTGTGLYGPFFSPDGDWIVFQAREGPRIELCRLSAKRPGEPEVLSPLPASILGADWGPDGTLTFGTLAGGIYRLEEGGVPEPVTTPESGVEWLHKFPDVLPGGTSLLYVVDFEGLGFEVRLRSSTDGREEVLIPGARWVRYLEPGVVLYVVGESLWADGFDPEGGRLAGDPVQLPVRIRKGIPAFVDVSPDGTLVYSAPRAPSKRSVRWVQRDGTIEETGLPVGQDYTHVAFSPDGTHAVFAFGHGINGGAVRVWDLARSRMDPPLVSELARHPVWTPDGEEVVWYSGDGGFLWRNASAAGTVAEKGGVFEAAPLHVLADGRVLYWHRAPDAETGLDLFLAPFDSDGRSEGTSVVTDADDQVYGVLSSDEKKVAYVSMDGLGMARLFVTQVPASGPGQLATPDGGAYPRWSRDGAELFYSYRGNLLRIGVTERGERFEFSAPVLIHAGMSTTTEWPSRPFDAAPDGQRFLVLEDDAPVERPRLFLVTNLLEAVRARRSERD